MSSKPKTTSSTQKSSSTSEPWGPAKGYLQDVYSFGSDALSATRNKLFGGDFIAGPTDAQRSSVQQLLAAAPGLGQGAVPLTDMAMRIASGEFLDPNNPVLMSGISAVTNPIQERLQKDVLPQISDAAVRGGAYGGTSQALRETTAANDFTRTAGDIGSKMTLDWMNSRFGDIFNAPGLFQGANTLALAPGTVTGLAGEQERGLDQLILDNELAQYQNELMMPWYGLQDFTNILTAGGFGKKSGTATTQTTGAAPDPATQWLQGGLGGLSALSSLGTAFPSTMGAIGGGSVMAPILSGLSFLSDRRFKRDITQIGKADNGLPIYRYRYIGEPGYQIGFIADEVEKVKPDAVFTSPDGVKYVDYRIATEA